LTRVPRMDTDGSRDANSAGGRKSVTSTSPARRPTRASPPDPQTHARPGSRTPARKSISGMLESVRLQPPPERIESELASQRGSVRAFSMMQLASPEAQKHAASPDAHAPTHPGMYTHPVWRQVHVLFGYPKHLARPTIHPPGMYTHTHRQMRAHPMGAWCINGCMICIQRGYKHLGWTHVHPAGPMCIPAMCTGYSASQGRPAIRWIPAQAASSRSSQGIRRR
jgi:hypothetical protein